MLLYSLYLCFLFSAVHLPLPNPEPHVACPPITFSKSPNTSLYQRTWNRTWKGLFSSINTAWFLVEPWLTSSFLVLSSVLISYLFLSCSVSYTPLPITVFRQSISSLPLLNLSLSKLCFGGKRPAFTFAPPPSPRSYQSIFLHSFIKEILPLVFRGDFFPSSYTKNKVRGVRIRKGRQSACQTWKDGSVMSSVSKVKEDISMSQAQIEWSQLRVNWKYIS